MTEEVKDLTPFILKGMVLSAQPELLDKGFYQYLQNIRVTEEGIIQSRPKIDIVGNIANNNIVNSIKTLFDKYTNINLGVVGIGDEVWVGYYSALINKLNGFSNKPKTFIAFRNEQAVSSSLAVADELKMVEVTIDGEVGDLGIDAPHFPPTFKLIQPDRKIIDNCDDATVWGRTGVVSGISIVNRINTSIQEIHYDEGVSGFCNIIPATELSNILEGTIIKVGTETTFVEEILKSALNATNIITKEDISPTEVEIVCANSTLDIRRGNTLLIDGSITVTVREVIESNINNDHSYICKCPDSSLINIGMSVEGMGSFRCYLVDTHVFGESIFADCLQAAVSGAGIGTITKVANYDFTRANQRSLHEDSIIYFAIAIESLATLDSFQIRLILNDSTSNYLYYELMANDFLEAANQTTSDIAIKQRFLQIQQLTTQLNIKPAQSKIFGGRIPDQTDFVPFIDAGVEPLFTAVGDNQFSIFKIPFSSFQRSGTDESLGLADITKIRFSFKMLATTNIKLDSIWIGGDSKNNSSEGFLAYNYIYRYEIESQGHISNWSPPLRNGIRADRNAIALTPVPSGDSRINSITWARFGGSLNSFRILGKTPNNTTPFIDGFSDAMAADNDRADREPVNSLLPNGDFDFFKPFPILDINRKGKCNVNVTKLTRIDGDRFKTSYPRATYIYVDGVLNQLYTNPDSTRGCELEKSMGHLENVDFFMKTPLMVGQPLPIIVGIWGQGFAGLVNFAFGDNLNAGTLYWFDSNSISVASDKNKTEITTPSEPLINGVMYDDSLYVFTNYNRYWITPDYTSGELKFIGRKCAGAKGLFARDAICSCSSGIYFQSTDGIYVVQGTGQPKSITENYLNNLFIHDGKLPESILLEDGTYFSVPDYSKLGEFRLFHARSKIYWRYIDLESKYCCLVYDITRGVWISKDTFPNNDIGVIYEDEKESDFDILQGFNGSIGTFTSSGIFDGEVESRVIMPARDFNEPTLIKNFQELVLDAFLNAGEELDVSLLFDGVVNPEIITGVNPAKRHIYRLDEDFSVVKIGIIYKWLLSSTLKLYRERLTFIPKANIIADDATDFIDMGFLGEKFWERLIIEADTFGKDKQLVLETDDGVEYVLPELNINQSGQQVRSYSFEPFIAHKVRIKSKDGVEWIRYNFRFIFDVEAELGTSFKTQLTNHDLVGLQHVKLITLSYAEAPDGVDLIVNIDGNKETYSFPATSLQTRNMLFLKPIKGNLFEYEIKSKSNKQFRFYKKHTMVFVKQENSSEDYVVKTPFGDISRETELKNV